MEKAEARAKTLWGRVSPWLKTLRGKATLQMKFSLSYILVIAAVLLLLNSYPLLVSQNLMVKSSQNNLRSAAKVIESALMGLEKLTKENVATALEGLDESGADRIMVMDSAARVMYDTRDGGNAVGKYALYSVVTVALRGDDASYCRYDGTAFRSRVATPVVYHNQVVGAVYAYSYDTEQAGLLEAFRHNLLIISLMIALLVAGLSIVLSRMLTRQIGGLLQAIRNVREGAYSPVSYTPLDVYKRQGEHVSVLHPQSPGQQGQGHRPQGRGGVFGAGEGERVRDAGGPRAVHHQPLLQGRADAGVCAADHGGRPAADGVCAGERV